MWQYAQLAALDINADTRKATITMTHTLLSHAQADSFNCAGL